MLSREKKVLGLLVIFAVLGLNHQDPGLAMSQQPSVKAPEATKESGPTPEEIQAMMALPYLQGYYPAPEATNVTRYDRSLAYPGYNLYSSGHAATAYLIDMKGKVLHEWSYAMDRLWPELVEAKIAPFWENIYLYPNGDLLAIYNRGGIIRIDKDSNLIWAHKCTAHHDIDLDEHGFIYTLTEDYVQLKEGVPILDNAILILSPEGQVVKKLSLFKLMLESRQPIVKEVFRRILGIAVNGGEDIYHANTLEILDGRLADKSPAFKKGNILTSMLTISTSAIINPQTEDFEWILGPYIWYQGQHNPTLLDNGNILTFDNHLDGSKEQSRVMEFDPWTKKVVWEYKKNGFYTDTHGANARLPNGNTLIIESNRGRVFEVTPDKRIVWEFLNPHVTGEKDDLIAAVFALYRISPDDVAAWLER